MKGITQLGGLPHFCFNKPGEGEGRGEASLTGKNFRLETCVVLLSTVLLHGIFFLRFLQKLL